MAPILPPSPATRTTSRPLSPAATVPLPERVRLREVRDAMKAQVALLGAQAWVRVSPRGRMLRSGETGPASGTPAAPNWTRAIEVARAVDRAARRGVFRPRCLARSVALQRMLRAEGIRGSRIHVGVRSVRGTFEAHAWVTLDGRVIGDEAAFVERFREIGEISIAELR